MSLGNQYLQAVNNDNGNMDEKSEGNLPARKPNIFNKARAIEASQKFSVSSD